MYTYKQKLKPEIAPKWIALMIAGPIVVIGIAAILIRASVDDPQPAPIPQAIAPQAEARPPAAAMRIAATPEVSPIASPVFTPQSQTPTPAGGPIASAAPEISEAPSGTDPDTKTRDSSGPEMSDSSGKTVHVSGYYRKDGTYVSGYDRRPPGSSHSHHSKK